MRRKHHLKKKTRCLAALLFLVSASAQAQVTPVTPQIVWQAQATNPYTLNPVAVSPDGSVVATLGGNSSVQIWSMSNGVPLIEALGNDSWISDLAFSPDGAYLAASGDGGVRVWRTTGWSPAYYIATARSSFSPVAFSPDSATLAIGNGATIELRRSTNGALFNSWPATSGWWVSALAFSPDGKMLASGAGARGMDNLLKLWELPTGTLLRSIPTAQTYSVGQVMFSPDGQQVLTGSDYLHFTGPMQSWRVADGSLLRTFPLVACGMAFSSDGSVLAGVGTNIMFFRASDGAVMQEFSDGFSSFTPEIKGIALAPTGDLFVRSRGHGQVLVGRVPVLVSVPANEGGKLVVRWVGGSGRYQLQHSLDPGGPWQDIGEVLATNSTVINSSTTTGYFRIVDLPL